MVRSRPLLFALLALVLAMGGTTAAVAAPTGSPPGHSQGVGAFDEEDVLRTLNRWALAYDDHTLDMETRLAMMEDCFTDDASFIYDATDFHAEWHGIDEVMALFEGALASQNDVRRHVMTNSIVERVDRRTAHVTSYLTLVVVADPHGAPEVVSSGIYRDTVKLEKDGVWRIQVRHLTLDTPPQ
ncbi:MAG TPA: nuclear transport factor 2 family protein [Natronosporangium sp.]|nr:nuclear transport factor 2 family protein [Natronosporangium sp.]